MTFRHILFLLLFWSFLALVMVFVLSFIGSLGIVLYFVSFRFCFFKNWFM